MEPNTASPGLSQFISPCLVTVSASSATDSMRLLIPANIELETVVSNPDAIGVVAWWAAPKSMLNCGANARAAEIFANRKRTEALNRSIFFSVFVDNNLLLTRWMRYAVNNLWCCCWENDACLRKPLSSFWERHHTSCVADLLSHVGILIPVVQGRKREIRIPTENDLTKRILVRFWIFPLSTSVRKKWSRNGNWQQAQEFQQRTSSHPKSPIEDYLEIVNRLRQEGHHGDTSSYMRGSSCSCSVSGGRPPAPPLYRRYGHHILHQEKRTRNTIERWRIRSEKALSLSRQNSYL